MEKQKIIMNQKALGFFHEVMGDRVEAAKAYKELRRVDPENALAGRRIRLLYADVRRDREEEREIAKMWGMAGEVPVPLDAEYKILKEIIFEGRI